MKKNKPTVTIGLPAYNEEKNIEGTVVSLMNQNTDRYTLDELVVVCDGSTDGTVETLKKLQKKYPKLKVVDRGKRAGKINAVNYIFHTYNSNILALFDADVLLVGLDVVNNLVSTIESSDVSLVAGIDNPKKPHNFLQELAVSWVSVWDESKRKVDDSLHNFSARIYAIRKDYYKNVVIPEEIICEDQYLYLRSKEMGFKFAIAKNAEIKYNIPDNLRDYIKQSLRFMQYDDIMYEHFGNKIAKYYYIASKIKRLTLVKRILMSPFYLPLSLVLQLYIRLKKKNYREKFVGNSWELISSTKKKI